MKRFMLALFAFATICTVSCKKESVDPENPTIKKAYMSSGGGDKRPSSHCD
ncbi:hypothetical protein [Mucilaginibacter arboris]|uniref:Uncharacterized protein n=1 Tax=Mucilaginibacter arboris TaxID=2682090 RepID=A0A7K1SSM9_9SPHI|nr:hypothetical protein [Mucilaginibacter arboris]MVN20326.1 hypothetical protein [Mucilaginibacter arboris]